MDVVVERIQRSGGRTSFLDVVVENTQRSDSLKPEWSEALTYSKNIILEKNNVCVCVCLCIGYTKQKHLLGLIVSVF